MIRIIFYIIAQFFKWRKQTILILLQNNNELRAAGGFITHLAKIEIGKLWFKLSFLDVFIDLKNSKKMAVPNQMRKLLKVRNLEFRDANYDPDFNNTAKTLVTIYNNLFPKEQVCILSAVNFSFIENSWKCLNPKKITNNLFHYLSTKVSNIDFHSIEELQNRKNILRDLFKKLIKSAVFKFWLWPQLWRNMIYGFKSKQLQFWSKSQKLLRKLKKKKLIFDFIKLNQGNFLAVIDDNYLGLKTNRYLRRQVFLDQKFESEDSVFNKLKISLTNFGNGDYPLSGLYQSSLRIYLPKEASDIKILNKSVIFRADEFENFKLVTLRLLIPVGLSRDLEIFYRDQVRIEDGFKYIKQSGVENEIFIHSVMAPDEFYINQGREQVMFNEYSVCKDVDIDYSFIEHKNSPRIYYHELINTDTILVKFNESVSFNRSRKNNIKIIGKNEQKQPFEIKDHYFKDENKDLYIKVNDLPQQEEEFYDLILSSIQNQSGKGFSNDERKMTVVYRSQRFF
ncbi:DUF4012 domain-containing protein [Patescibacteria group bacterium]